MSDPRQFITTLRHSHEQLSGRVGELDEAALVGPSYDSEWTIAQVLSHLGSGAEIFGLILAAALKGEDPPGRDAFSPIWAQWDARTPSAMRTESLAANARLIERFEQLDDEELASLRLSLWGRDLDASGLLTMRLSEHAVHNWDVAVSFDDASELAADAVTLLVDTLPTIAARTGRTGQDPVEVAVLTSDPERRFLLSTGGVRLEPIAAGGEVLGGNSPTGTSLTGTTATLELPAAALIRLVYGRLDPAHTPALHVEGVELDDLRSVFPGF